MAGLLAGPAAGLPVAVDAACARHPDLADALRRRLRLLLGGGYLGAADDGDRHPERIGPFRVLSRLGGGGMGIVWRAREEPVARHVALKLIRPEQVPFATARSRFLREIRIVAGLSHPGIVPVFSYGEEEGLLYYAMELVTGASLAERLAALSGRDPARLPADALGARDPECARPKGYVEACCALVCEVALALSHAHERGVVHRDVKPSNVMLGDDGRARLIDFGLARAAGDATITRGGSQPGSLAYMSPEQVRGEEVDARADVYSLGLTLYELLSLRSPFLADTEERTRRLVLLAEPPALRSFNPAVPWEVIAICATAMAPERDHRYPTMAAMAHDLAAFQARRPIRARTPGPYLRARRFAQRRPALVTGLVLGFVLAAGLPTALWVKERSARVAIAREAQRTRKVAAFLQRLLHEAQPDTAGGTTLTTRGFLERCVRRVRAELEEEPAIRADLLDVLGRLLRSVGLLRLSEEALREGVELLEQQPDTDPARLAEVRVYLANALLQLGEYAEAESLYRAWLATSGHSSASGSIYCQLGEAVARQGRAEEGLKIIEQGLAALRREQPPDRKRLGYGLLQHARMTHAFHGPGAALAIYEEARDVMDRSVKGPAMRKVATLPYVASCLADLGRHADAETLHRAALAMARELFDADHPHLAQAHQQYGGFLLARGRIAQARVELDSAITAFREAYPGPHFDLADALNLDSRLRYEAGDLAGAGQSADEALAMYEQIAPNGHRDFAAALGSLAWVHMARGSYVRAEELARRSLAMHESCGLRRADDLALARSHLAYILALQGRFGEAEETARASRAPAEAESVGPGLRVLLDCQAAEVLLLAGKAAEAEPLAEAALARCSAAGDEDLRAGAWALHLVGWARNQQGDSSGAEARLREALTRRTRLYPAGHPVLAISGNELGVALARLGKTDASRTELEKALAIRRRALAPDDPFLALSLVNLGSLLVRSGHGAEAEPLLLEGLRILARREARDDPRAVAAIRLLVDLLGARGPEAGTGGTRTELASLAGRLLSPAHELSRAVARLADSGGGR